MARLKTSYACGHTVIVYDAAEPGETQSPDLCGDCKRFGFERPKQETSIPLPRLTGSEKQILWAEKIRESYVSAWQREKKTIPATTHEEQAEVSRVIGVIDETICRLVEAKWWIDHRNNAIHHMIEFWLREAGINPNELEVII